MNSRSRPCRIHRDAGQAAVEAALTLPFTLFLAMGALQLFMMLQARIVTEYAVYQAVHAGAMRHGDCGPMTDAAVLALLPTMTRTDSSGALTGAFAARRFNRFTSNDGISGPIVELVRESPSAVPFPEDPDFDSPGELKRLELRLLYWYPLRVPFADWVMSRMFVSYLGVQDYDAVDPLVPAKGNAGWTRKDSLRDDGWPGGPLGARLLRHVNDGEYVFPIRATFSMRMMTPAKGRFFVNRGCPL